MHKLLFICHGNICRSTMAEFVMKYLVEEAGLSSEFFIDSAATSREAIGMPVDLRTVRKLKKEGIPCGKHRAKQVTIDDYNDFDMLIGMDSKNLRNMERVLGSDDAGKFHKLLEFCPENQGMDKESVPDIADPWYTGNFEITFVQVMAGCKALLQKLLNE
ncbi:MAG: low molecular weight phosphotyrosine protein phosphatase [Treponemataceae bacterium]|nr:low molecular weight phosphotyrosine protein phosphatase [Treponemataceae bacterium]